MSRPFCPKCGSETEQTCMAPFGGEDRNLARCAACGWEGLASECKESTGEGLRVES